MSRQQKNIIAISYAKRALIEGSRERERMYSYADQLDSYHVIVFTRKKEGFLAVQTEKNLSLYATNARTKVGMLWRAYRIGRQILKQNNSCQFVVSSQDPFESSLVGRALARTRNAVHHVQLHGDFFNPANYKTTALQRLRVTYGRFVVRRTTIIRVVSERIKTSLVKLGVMSDRIQILSIQSDLTSLLEVGKNRIHSPEKTLRIVFLGRLAPEKRVSVLIDACALLQEREVQFHLQVVGSGPLEADLKKQVSALHLEQAVTFIPWTDDIGAVLSNSDVFCLTSAHEGWGMVLLEAGAAGVAIVSTDVGCVGELLVPEESVLVADTAEQFASSIIRLTDHELRNKITTNARDIVSQYSVSTQDYNERWIAGHF